MGVSTAGAAAGKPKELEKKPVKFSNLLRMSYVTCWRVPIEEIR